MRAAFRFFGIARICAVICATVLALTLGSCSRNHTAGKKDKVRSSGDAREGLATWYDVPVDSLAKRRAGGAEFTAAHNRLPIGTLLQVTHLANGKSVRVRITDRGIHDRRVKLDLCKEAAAELGMVGKGVARVRMEVLAETGGGSSADANSAAAQR